MKNYMLYLHAGDRQSKHGAAARAPQQRRLSGGAGEQQRHGGSISSGSIISIIGRKPDGWSVVDDEEGVAAWRIKRHHISASKASI